MTVRELAKKLTYDLIRPLSNARMQMSSLIFCAVFLHLFGIVLHDDFDIVNKQWHATD